MNVAIIRFPGTNCEFDTQYAFEKLGATTQLIWHKQTALDGTPDLVVIAGGFSYGDYLRSGAIARFSPVMQTVSAYAKEGGRVLGICNGFQVLTESHLLPGALMGNNTQHFISRHHHLKVVSTANPLLRKCGSGNLLNIPIAHHDGNYFIDDDGLKALQDNDQILLRYCDADGNPANPNGSVDRIAGICNADKTIFGLMPHPERAMEAVLGSDDGVRMLEGFFAA